jgi:hypothetical protein
MWKTAGNSRRPKTRNIVSNPENANTKQKLSKRTMPMRASRAAWRAWSSRKIRVAACFTRGGSGSFRYPKVAAASESPAARKPGAPGAIPASSPPIHGPSVNPRPNAAPISPMPLARFSGVVTSAM